MNESWKASDGELYAEFLLGDLPEFVGVGFVGLRVFGGFLAVGIEGSAFDVVREQSVKSGLASLN